MSRSNSLYMTDPEMEIDLGFECWILSTEHKSTAEGLHEEVREAAGIEHTDKSKRSRYYTVEELRALVGEITGELPGTHDRVRLRRAIEDATAMPPRPSLQRSEAAVFNKHEQCYLLAAAMGKWPEVE